MGRTKTTKPKLDKERNVLQSVIDHLIPFESSQFGISTDLLNHKWNNVLDYVFLRQNNEATRMKLIHRVGRTVKHKLLSLVGRGAPIREEVVKGTGSIPPESPDEVSELLNAPESDTETDTETNAETTTKSTTDTETKAEAEAKADTETKAEAKTASETTTESPTEAEPTTEAEAKADTETKAEAEPTTEAEAKADTETKAEAEPTTGPGTDTEDAERHIDIEELQCMDAAIQYLRAKHVPLGEAIAVIREGFTSKIWMDNGRIKCKSIKDATADLERISERFASASKDETEHDDLVVGHEPIELEKARADDFAIKLQDCFMDTTSQPLWELPVEEQNEHMYGCKRDTLQNVFAVNLAGRTRAEVEELFNRAIEMADG